MPDDFPGGGDGGGDRGPGGIKKEYLWVGGAALLGGLAWLWWERRHAKPSSSTTTVITGSVSSNTGISGSMLNAILKDWQENPGSTSGSTGTGGGGGGKKTASTGTGTKKTTKTSTTGTKKPAPPKKTPAPPKRDIKPVITGYKEVTVKAGQTLDEIAKEYGITPAELASQNVYVRGELPDNAKVGQTLGTGAGLKTGQVLKVPVYGKKG